MEIVQPNHELIKLLDKMLDLEKEMLIIHMNIAQSIMLPSFTISEDDK